MSATDPDMPAPSAELIPAPSPSAPAHRSAASLARHQTRALLEVHIGLPIVIEALEFAISSEPTEDAQGYALPLSKFALMYEDLADPCNRLPIDTLMGRYGVKLPELLALIGARNLGMAIMKSAPRLERVIDGVGESAEPRDEMCEKCDGEGWLATGPVSDGDADADEGEESLEVPREMCAKCKGKGSVRVRGDLDAAKMFIALHGGNTSGGKGAGDARNVINVVASASAKAESKKSGDGAGESITKRVQGIIDV